MTTSHTNTAADWADILTVTVRHALAQMDTTLTLAEAKTELTRHLVNRRATWDARGHDDRAVRVASGLTIRA